MFWLHYVKNDIQTEKEEAEEAEEEENRIKPAKKEQMSNVGEGIFKKIYVLV